MKAKERYNLVTKQVARALVAFYRDAQQHGLQYRFLKSNGKSGGFIITQTDGTDINGYDLSYNLTQIFAAVAIPDLSVLSKVARQAEALAAQELGLFTPR